MAHVTLTASKVTFGNTRSSLNENDPKDGALHFSWDLNDVIYVTDTENAYKGRLVVNKLDDAGNATFDGMMEAEIFNGEKDYVFYFLGNNTKIDEKTGQIDSKEYDFSSQDGMLSSLDDDDLLIKQAKMSFKDGEGSVSVVFDRQFAYAHFKLVYDDETLDTHGVPVTISASNLSPKASVDFTNKTIIPGDVASFTVTPSSNPVPDDENGFYVGLVPNDSETTLTFTCTVNGVDFTGTRTLKKLEKNDFYRLNETNGYKAIPIEMKPAKQYRVIYNIYDNFHQEGQERYCSSKAYIVNGDPTAFTPLDCAQVEIDPGAPRDNVDKADFKNYFYDFLGWTTVKDSWEDAWKKDKFNFSKENYVKVNKVQTGENTTIDLTKYAVEETEGNVTYYDVNLYALGSVMLYEFKTVKVSSSGTESNVQSPESAYRMRDWYDFKITQDLSKPGHEFLGWSRKDKEDNLIDEENQYLKGGTFRLTKDDECAKYEADYNESNSNDADKGPVIGKVSIKLYPILKKIENGDVNLNKYTTGSLK